VVGAGRTDTGVHARGQAVHFDLLTTEHDTNSNNLEQQLETAMNKMLPPDIRVWNLGMAPAPCEEHVKNHDGTKKVYAWNVMRKSSSKLYSYRICLADAMDPLRRHDRWQIDSNWFQSGNTKMDPEHLAQLLCRYEGTHDFICFAGALEANARKTGVKMTTVRTVHRCELICEDEHYKLYRIDIYLDGALYKMVRNLVGTAIDVWRQAFPQESFGRLLDEPSKHGLTRDDNPCKPAPPHGLTLERVFYAGDDDF
jgi:tRNA pseudouridine38-40 synthase